MVIRDMSEAAQGPKDWWQVLVDVREAEKRKSEEATFMALRKQLEDSDNFAASPGRVIGEAVSKNQKAIKGGRQIGSSNTSGSWNTEMEPDNCAELLKGDNQAMLEENTKVPQKKKKNKLKSKKKKKDYVGTTISVVNTSAGSDEHGEPQFRESSKREVVPFEPSVFTFDLKDEPNKDPNEDCSSGKDMKVEVDNTSSPTVDADSGPQQKGKCHRRVSKSVAQAKVHEELHDSSRNAAVERLRGEALPMSLEDARGKRTTLREERSASIQFLRQRTLSRGSSVSGSRPASPPQRDSRPKVDMILLEDVDKITHSPTSQRNPSVTTEVAPPDEGHWQTVTKQKPKKQPNNKSMANKQGVPRMKTSRKDRQSEVVANFSAREQPSKASRTSLATVSQGVNLGQAVASSRLVETLSDQGPKIPQQAKMDRAEGNIPSQGRPNAAATAPRNGLGVIEELTLEDLEDPMHTEPIYPVSDNTARLTGSEMLIRAINAWQDQSDNEFENTTDRQALLRDPLFHSANNEAYVFHDRPFVVPAHLVNEDNLRNGTCFPNLQILLGDPYTGEIPEQVWLDPATPPRLCKCTVLEGNRALVNYEPSIHRMIIHPMMNPRPDHRNNPYHPDFLPPSKLAEYQAYEQAGYPVYRFDRVTFECNLSSCRKVIRDHVRSTVLCNGCGPYSDVRYCSKKHLFEDCKTHWQTCGLTPSRIVWDDWTMPSRYKRRYPAIKDIHGRTTPERQRQQAYSIHHPASDYVIFNDWQDKQNSGEECRGTGEPIVFLIFRDGDPKKDMFNRLLNIAFFGKLLSPTDSIRPSAHVQTNRHTYRSPPR